MTRGRRPPGRWNRALRAGGRATYVIAALDAFTEATQGKSIFDTKTWTTNQQGKPLHWSDAVPFWKWGHPNWNLLDPRKSSGIAKIMGIFGGGNDQERQVRQNQITLAQAAFSAEGRRGRVVSIADPGVNVQEQGGVVTLNVNVKTPDGKTTRAKVHIPQSIWKNNNVPTRQGKVGGRR